MGVNEKADGKERAKAKEVLKATSLKQLFRKVELL